MNWADYQVGRRVVCLGGYGDEHLKVMTSIPIKGGVYTIRATHVGANVEGVEMLGLRFREIRGLSLPGAAYHAVDGEWWFAAVEFRPLDERRLDVFRELLAPTPREGVAA